MLKAICLVIAGISATSAHAENIIRVSAPIKGAGTWESIPMVYTDWVATGQTFDCSPWLPARTSYPEGTPFMQWQYCSERYQRTGQAYERNTKTNETRPVGQRQVDEKIQQKTFSQLESGTGGTYGNCKYSQNPATYVMQQGPDSIFYTWMYNGEYLTNEAASGFGLGELMGSNGTEQFYAICERPIQ